MGHDAIKEQVVKQNIYGHVVPYPIFILEKS